MSGTNTAEIVVGASGKVLVAPLATAAPTDVVMAWPTGWIDLGFTSEAGVKVTDSKTMVEVKGWQSFYTLRRIVSGRSFKVTFSLKQFNKNNIPFAFGGGAVTTPVVGATATVSNKALATNVATLTTSAPHGFAAGNTVVVTGVDAVFNGTYAITSVTSTTFSYALTHADVTSAVATGTATVGVTYRYAPPAPQTVDEREMGIEWADGSKIYRLILPKGLSVDPVAADLARTKEAELPIGFEVTASDVSVDAWYLITNDPSFA